MAKRATIRAMGHTLAEPWTQERFFDWAETQAERYEFDGFEPIAMTGGNANHSVIIRNLHRALDRRLGDGPCQYLGTEAGVQTIGKTVRYPDALVTCSPFKGTDRVIPGVVVIFEVLSPGSGHIDGHVKVEEYAAVPTIRRYVILESSRAGLTVRERSDPAQPWHKFPLTIDDILRIPELQLEIPVSELYQRVSFSDRLAG